MLLNQVIHDEPPSPRRLNGAIPKDLETIVLKCLEKSPEKRYGQAADVAAELRRFSTERTDCGSSYHPHERSWRWMKRNPTTSTLGSALLLSLILGLAGTLWMWSDAVKRRRSPSETL